MQVMARSATTSDVFNAIAEVQRRQVLDLLAGGERSVNDIAAALGIRQPQASKHLRVLKEVGLVSVRGSGQQRLYRLNGAGLKPIHDWTTTFERYWEESFDRFVQRAPDGGVHAFHGVFHSVDAPARVVQTFEYEGMPGHVIMQTATYEEHDGQTRMTTQAVFQSVENRDGMIQSGMEHGENESVERLDEVLAQLKV